MALRRAAGQLVEVREMEWGPRALGDAVRCFLRTELDDLVIGDIICERS